jgi:hypothetical protein
MSNIIKKGSININSQYKVDLIEEDVERFWLILVDLNLRSNGKFVSCWSNQVKEKERIPYQLIIQILRERLEEVAKGKISFDDAIEFWPKGWDYWGRFTPDPIKYYIHEAFR